jgi:hypothetical protein
VVWAASSHVLQPAFAQPPHLKHGALAVWFTHPAGAVVQFQHPVRGTLEYANWLVGPAYAELDKRFPHRGALTLVLDLELMTGRSVASRSVFLAKAREVGDRFGRGFVVPPRNAPRAYAHALRVGVAVIRSLGIQVDIVESSQRAIAMCDLRSMN